MTLQALKTEEEIAGVPLDRPILIELPGGVIEDGKTNDGKTSDVEPAAKSLQEQLEAMKAQTSAATERANKAERDATEARRIAADRERELTEQRTKSVTLEGDIITGGLAAAQAELTAAEAEFERAGEVGDFKAMGKANARIGRASAQVVSLEAGAAEIAERKTVQPEVRHQTAQPAPDPIAAIDANPNLMATEKEWLRSHPDAILDPRRNNELGVGYDRAVKEGLVRGTPQYFEYLEKFMGYAKPATDNNGSRDVQAPVSRNERDVDGRPSGNKVMLSAEQREMAKLMGVSEIDYARNHVRLEAARKADPERYSNSR